MQTGAGRRPAPDGTRRAAAGRAPPPASRPRCSGYRKQWPRPAPWGRCSDSPGLAAVAAIPGSVHGTDISSAQSSFLFKHSDRSVLAGTPDGDHQPDAVEERCQESQQAEQGQAEQGWPASDGHDDRGADNQRRGQHPQGQAAGATVDLMAEIIQALEIEIDLEAA